MALDSSTDDLLPLLAAGHVLRWRQAIPRLAPEAVAILFRRYVQLAAPPGPVAVLDPCCGNGVVLAVLQVVFGSSVARLVGSDADPVAVAQTTGNLDLLNVPEALERRIGTLTQQRRITGNERLDEAIRDGRRLARLGRGERPRYRVSCVDALAPIEDRPEPDPGATPHAGSTSDRGRFHLVLTDPPYGRQSDWIDEGRADRDSDDRLRDFLAGATSRLAEDGWIALALDRELDPTRVAAAVPDRGELVETADLPKRRGYWIRRRRLAS